MGSKNQTGMTTNKMFKRGGLITILWVVLSGCYYDQVLPMKPDIEVGEATFSDDIVPIFNKNCNSSGCHNGSVNPNLLPANAYNELLGGGYINKSTPSESELYKWMIGDKGTPMPPAGPDATNNAKVLAWIEQGALNN
jgi:hypothetical protein